MTKTELIKQVAKKSEMSQKDTDVILKNFFEVVKQTVKNGEKVAVIGFGNFEARQRASRTGVNPKTRKKMTIPAKRVPVFRPGKAFKEAVSSKK
jgi:DNA-binding protein HU-beta